MSIANIRHSQPELTHDLYANVPQTNPVRQVRLNNPRPACLAIHAQRLSWDLLPRERLHDIYLKRNANGMECLLFTEHIWTHLVSSLILKLRRSSSTCHASHLVLEWFQRT